VIKSELVGSVVDIKLAAGLAPRSVKQSSLVGDVPPTG
jgi:hypothetical protein